MYQLSADDKAVIYFLSPSQKGIGIIGYVSLS